MVRNQINITMKYIRTETMTEKKKCAACNELKELEEFQKVTETYSLPYCNACRKQIAKEYAKNFDPKAVKNGDKRTYSGR